MSTGSKSYWFHNTKKVTVKKTGHLITVDFIKSKLWLRFQFRELMLIFTCPHVHSFAGFLPVSSQLLD